MTCVLVPNPGNLASRTGVLNQGYTLSTNNTLACKSFGVHIRKFDSSFQQNYSQLIWNDKFLGLLDPHQNYIYLFQQWKFMAPGHLYRYKIYKINKFHFENGILLNNLPRFSRQVCPAKFTTTSLVRYKWNFLLLVSISRGWKLEDNEKQLR